MITKNLSEDEVRCKCCGDVVFHRGFCDRLQIIRDIVGIPFIHQSFFRCRDYNDSLPNSSPTSQHTLGRATDILTQGFTGNQKWQLVKAAMSLGFSVGIYSAHIHLDYRNGDPTIFYGSY